MNVYAREKKKRGGLLIHRYNIDTLVIMPVNPETFFIYWEITKKRMNGYRSLPNRKRYIITRIIDEQKNIPIHSFKIQEMVGSRYVRLKSDAQRIYAEIGLIRNEKFEPLIRSRTIVTFNVSHPGREIWMKKFRNKMVYIDPPLKGKTGAMRKIYEHYKYISSGYPGSSF